MLGLVTIGQSPRNDVTASMFGSGGVDFVEAGALDGLNDDEIAALAPSGSDHVLVTRLTDGREVVVAKERLLARVQSAADRVVAHGATVVCVLCTGAFPELTAPVLLVFPDRLLFGVVDATLPRGTLGVVMPHPGQHATMIEKWTSPDRRVLTGSVSPYAGGSVDEVVATLRTSGADAIVLDCMGFDRVMLAQARAEFDGPVFLANGVVGAILGEMTATAQQPVGAR
ncbi:MAG: AroM family protein [Thermomicrobiales bacterium]|nr:AroM family protein [Thermomicrobiales bacterium]